jgi:hypothetical protein
MISRSIMPCVSLLFGVLFPVLLSSAGQWGELTYQLENQAVAIVQCETSVLEVIIPDHIEGLPVKAVANNAFKGCDVMQALTLPVGLERIGGGAFYGCKSLDDLELPNSLKTIEDYAFYACEGLEQVFIPPLVQEIGREAFSQCISLRIISVDPKNLVYHSLDGVLYDHDLRRLIRYPNAKVGETFFLPSSVQVVEEGAFWGCDKLEEVTLPDEVVELGSGAFGHCFGLTAILGGNSLSHIGAGAFLSCSNLRTLKLPNRLVSMGNAALAGCSSLVHVSLPEGLLEIGADVFHQCTGLISVSLPSTLTGVGNNAFRGCSNLLSLTLPDKVTSLGEYALEGCAALTSVSLPATVAFIGDWAFANTPALEQVRLPNAFHSRLEASRLGLEALYPWGIRSPHALSLIAGDLPPHIRLAPVIMVQGDEGSLKTIEVAEDPEGPWRLWMQVTATQAGVAITDLQASQSRRFYRVRD